MKDCYVMERHSPGTKYLIFHQHHCRVNEQPSYPASGFPSTSSSRPDLLLSSFLLPTHQLVPHGTLDTHFVVVFLLLWGTSVHLLAKWATFNECRIVEAPVDCLKALCCVFLWVALPESGPEKAHVAGSF